MENTVYAGNKGANVPNTRNTPSPFLWHDCPWREIREGARQGGAFHEDFAGWGGSVASNVGTYYSANGRWTSREDTGTSILKSTSAAGTLVLTSTTTDNIDTNLEYGNQRCGLAAYSSSLATKMWFEARLKLLTVTDAMASVFVGLAEAGLAVDSGLLPDTDALTLANFANKDWLGATVLNPDGDALIAAYHKTGQAAVTATYNSGSAPALTADTYFKVGMKVDPSHAKPIRWFVNGVEVGYVTDATNVPTLNLTPQVHVKQRGATAQVLSTTFIRFAWANYNEA